MKIDVELNKLEATGVRAMKYVNYFGRTYMTDRLIICLIVLTAAALIAVIVVCILQKKSYYVVTTTA
jgi:hypothetical protein